MTSREPAGFAREARDRTRSSCHPLTPRPSFSSTQPGKLTEVIEKMLAHEKTYRLVRPAPFVRTRVPDPDRGRSSLSCPLNGPSESRDRESRRRKAVGV